nr:LysR family transcriptional regulator [Acidovorax sp.]
MDRLLLSMRVFERVVTEGGFASAARALDMSPPVVTRLVADLEDHLGTRLLQRSTRRLSLTEAGQSYLDRVRHILQDIEEAHAVASAHTQEMVGTLRIHALPVLATHVISPLLPGFFARYPRIRIDLDVETRRELPIEDFDLTLIGTREGFDANVVARKVADSEAILVASPIYVKRKGLPSAPNDLPQHACLMHALALGRASGWSMWCSENPTQSVSVAVEPIMVSNHTDSLVQAALDGVGIASVAINLVAPYLTRGELVRVLSPWVTGRFSLYAAMPSRKFVPQRTRVFLDYLIEQTQEQTARALQACKAV